MFKNSIGTLKFITIVTIIDMLLFNIPLYNYAISNLNMSSSSGILTFSSVIVAVFVITFFLLSIIAVISSKLLKIFSMIMMITNAIAVYFLVTYETILDTTMMGNAFNTDIAEASSYYHPKLLIYILFLGVIPAFMISKIKVVSKSRVKLIIYSIAIFTSGVFYLYLNASTWLWFDKYAKKLGGMTMPWSYTINAIRYQTKRLKKDDKQILLPDVTIKNDNKMVVVLVIGESARSDNFSLYGYSRETNKLLKDVKNLSILSAKSTATYTTASVHSMLSYKGETDDSYEPLPNYLQRIGIDVIWRKNNWGTPKLKVGTLQSGSDLKPYCTGSGCDYDEVLLTNLKEEINKAKTNKVFVVLHTAGSHGPVYYKKYPKRFEIFKPVCKTVDLKECTKQELINAYDNTIAYTDYFLDKTIKELKKLKDTPVMMIYASDHGESLGEYGLYLHGTPYSIAPDYQKNIPFFIWRSENFINKNNKILNDKNYGHNNIFHTVLGAFGIKSSVYNKKLDIMLEQNKD